MPAFSVPVEVRFNDVDGLGPFSAVWFTAW